MKTVTLEPWAIDIKQRIIPIGVDLQDIADRIMISRSHVWGALSGNRLYSKRTKMQIIRAVKEFEAEFYGKKSN